MSPAWGCWLALATLLACASGRGPGASRSGPPRVFDRDAFNPYICAAWSTEANQWGAEFLSRSCNDTSNNSCEARAVDVAERVVAVGNRAYTQFYGAVGDGTSVPKNEADRLAREAFWSDPALKRAVKLAAADSCGVSPAECDDCAEPTPSPQRLTWEAFRPYVSAYLWPVQARSGAEIELYTCSEVNGADGLPGPDLLRQAGFLVAAGFAEDEVMFVAVQGLVRSHNQRATRSIPSLAGEIEAFLELPAARARICHTLTEVRWFTGLTIEECPPG